MSNRACIGCIDTISIYFNCMIQLWVLQGTLYFSNKILTYIVKIKYNSPKSFRCGQKIRGEGASPPLCTPLSVVIRFVPICVVIDTFCRSTAVSYGEDNMLLKIALLTTPYLLGLYIGIYVYIYRLCYFLCIIIGYSLYTTMVHHFFY